MKQFRFSLVKTAIIILCLFAALFGVGSGAASHENKAPHGMQNDRLQNKGFSIKQWAPSLVCNPPQVPLLVAPVDGLETKDSALTLIWNPASDASLYQVEVSDDAGFSRTLVDRTLPGTTYTRPIPYADGTYFWRVRSINASGECFEFSDWSSPWQFTIHSTPVLVAPANGALTADTTPRFNWYTVEKAETYDIQVDNHAGFESPEVDTNVIDSEYTPGATLPQGTFYWRVRWRGEDRVSDWSPIWKVSIDLEAACNTPGTPELFAPSSGIATANASPALRWGSTEDTGLYQVEISKQVSFDQLAGTVSLLDTSFVRGTPFAEGTYYWRVRSRNIAGQCNITGAWSSVWQFTVSPAPVLISPADLAAGNEDTPRFNWYSIPGVDNYEIEVDDSLDFLSPIIDETTVESDYTPGSGLPEGNYYWRVRWANRFETSPWSPVRTLLIDPAIVCSTPDTPELVIPENNGITRSDRPLFIWYAPHDAFENNFQLDTHLEFEILVLNETTMNTVFTPDEPLEEKTYYWRTRIKNTSGDCDEVGAWSSIWEFAINRAPVLLSPPDGSTTDDNTPLFDWQAVDEAVSYKINVDDNLDFTSPEIDEIVPESEHTPATPLADGVYYWRVRWISETGTSGWSAVWRVTIDTVVICTTPGTPELIAPENNTATTNTLPGFSWNPTRDTTGYEIQVSNEDAFISPVFNTIVTGTAYTAENPLSEDLYTWRVRSRNTSEACNETGAWSTPWQFTVSKAPVLVSPPDGATIDDPAPVFEWKSVPGVQSYRIQVDDQEDFSSPEIDGDTTGFQYSPGSPLQNGRYFWRVRWYNEAETSDWSPAWSLTIHASIVEPPFILLPVLYRN